VSDIMLCMPTRAEMSYPIVDSRSASRTPKKIGARILAMTLTRIDVVGQRPAVISAEQYGGRSHLVAKL
jgi:hypothetical protein